MIKNKTVKIKQVMQQRLEVQYNIDKLDNWVIKQVYPLQWDEIDSIINTHHCFRAILASKTNLCFSFALTGASLKKLDYDAYGGAPECIKYVG